MDDGGGMSFVNARKILTPRTFEFPGFRRVTESKTTGGVKVFLPHQVLGLGAH